MDKANKVLDIKLIIEEDDEGYITHKVRSAKTDEIRFYESEWNATNCPEDMYFNRDLFSGYNYINAIKLGMKLAKEGYDDLYIIVEEIKDLD